MFYRSLIFFHERRAIGRRLDPATGIVYHLEYHPPPEHKGIHGRLVIIDEDNKALLHQKMSFFKDELPKLEKWFARFNNFKELDGNSTVGEIVSAMQPLLEQVAPPGSLEQDNGLFIFIHYLT